MSKHLLFSLFFIGISLISYSQINFTAKDMVPPYQESFRYGSNLGNYPPWTNDEVGNIAAGNEALDLNGIGVQNFRVALQEFFVEAWGYDIRKDDFEHWEGLGMKDHLMMIGWPSEEHRDQTFYCTGFQSEVFANLYDPIWDGGAHGTPVNEDNYYALYVYKVVNEYKDYIKFYEVWNEPDFTLSSVAWNPPGVFGSWWDNNPAPCDLAIGAPIYNYIRMLRIAYEVIKSVDPSAYICTGGIGNPAFLDAIMRNTDNPVDGSITTDYPHKGGAWFDVLSYHSYPHIDGSMWEFPAGGGLVYHRHSDRGVEGMLARQEAMRDVLNNYFYDGGAYPKKLWVLSETMVPRVAFNNYIGSNEAQVNYLLKALVEAQRNDIEQVDVFTFSELSTEEDAWNEYLLMGLYENLSESTTYNQILTDAGIAFHTINSYLQDVEYDEAKTNQMDLPSGIQGIAFQKDNEHVYVLWAKTDTDQSEEKSATYSFPASFGLEEVEIRHWDYSQTQNLEIGSSQNISLTARPIFAQEATISGAPPSVNFSQNMDEGCVPFSVTYNDLSTNNPSSWNWTFESGSPATSSDPNPTVTYFEAGSFDVSLTASNDFGSNSYSIESVIEANDVPEPSFDFVINEFSVEFINNSQNGENYIWNFGDGETSNEINPTYSFEENGLYNVTLTAINECGNNSISNDVFIQVNSISDIDLAGKIKIYPNPNDGQFSLSLDNWNHIGENINIRLIDLLGKEVYHKNVLIDNDDYQVDIQKPNLIKGVYLLELEIKGGLFFKKVVIN